MAYEINQRTEADYRWFRFEAPTELLELARPQPEDRRRRPPLPDLQSRSRRAGDGPARRHRRPRRRASASAPEPPRGPRASPAPTPPSDAERRRVARRLAPLLCGNPPSQGERVAPAALLDWDPDKRIQRSESLGSFERERSGHHREPDPGSRSCAAPAAGPPSASCGSRSTAAARTARRGEWVDKPNYFDVTVWGAQGENCANYLSKGRPVAVEGRLDWREWEAKDGSGKRQAVRSSPTPSSSSARATAPAAAATATAAASAPSSDVPADTSDFEGAAGRRRRRRRRRRRHSVLARSSSSAARTRRDAGASVASRRRNG